MTRHAIVNQDNIVVNVVIWEGAAWLPPHNHTVVRSDLAGIGDRYIPEKNVFERIPVKIVLDQPVDN